jgi:hypothetical protein
MHCPLAMRHWRGNWLALLQGVNEGRLSDGADGVDAVPTHCSSKSYLDGRKEREDVSPSSCHKAGIDFTAQCDPDRAAKPVHHRSSLRREFESSRLVNTHCLLTEETA